MIEGYGNSFGSSWVLLMAIVVGLVWTVTQPSGQVALGLGWVVGMVGVVLGEAERRAVVLSRQRAAGKATETNNGPPATVATSTAPIHLSSTEIGFFNLLSHLVFFSSGHQATFSSIQWRVAFLTSPTLTYPLSPVLVLLNSFGHLTLLASLFTVLALLWSLSPLPRGSGRRMPLPRQLVSALLGVALYNLALLCSLAALSGLVFQRHLMLFKVWTPRLLMAVVGGVGGQLVGLAVAVAAWQVANKVGDVFGSEFE